MDEKELKVQYADLQILGENLSAQLQQIQQKKLAIRAQLNKIKDESTDTPE